MKKQTQYGKGLAGFLSGLLLATAVIIGILFFLNKGNQNEFKDLSRSKKNVEPEVLKPQEKPKAKPAPRTESPEPEPEPETKSEPAQPAKELPPAKAEKEETAPPAKADTVKPAEKAVPAERQTAPEEGRRPAAVPSSEPKAPSKPKASVEDDRDTAERAAQEREEQAAQHAASAEKQAAEAKRKAELAKKRAEQAAGSKKAEEGLTDKQKARAERKMAEKKEAEKKAADKKAEAKKQPNEKAAKEARPTPEQILNSGSIEKARKAASEEAKQTAEAKPSAKAAKAEKAEQAEKTEKADAAKPSGRKVVVQMGSYAQRAPADAQRAKLAMMGVQSRVVESQADGKTVYRIQSGALDKDEAKRVQQTLQKNGVGSFVRSAQ